MINRNYYKKYLQYKCEEMLRRRAFVFQAPRHGIEDVLDIGRLFNPDDAILDIGANVGQSAIRFRAAFPSARIVSFEPIAATYAKLKQNTRGLNIETHNVALGPEAKTETMFLTPFSETNSLVRPPESDLLGSEQVKVTTLDQFVRENSIGPIGLLKIDAEGYDLKVIEGAIHTLAAGAVRFVLVEVGFHPEDERHPLFDKIRYALAPFGFRVFGIYNQSLEWTGAPSLRFANALFCRCANGQVPAENANGTGSPRHQGSSFSASMAERPARRFDTPPRPA
jgi:FkbM family methyltransferase